MKASLSGWLRGLLLCALLFLGGQNQPLQAEYRHIVPTEQAHFTPKASPAAQKPKAQQQTTFILSLLGVILLLLTLAALLLGPIAWLVFAFGGASLWLQLALGSTLLPLLAGLIWIPFLQTAEERLSIAILVAFVGMGMGFLAFIAGLFQSLLWLWAGGLALLVLASFAAYLIIRRFNRMGGEAKKPQFFTRK